MIESLSDAGEGPGGREGPHVKLIEDEPLRRDACPSGVVPHVRSRVDHFARPMYVIGLKSGCRVRDEHVVVDPEPIACTHWRVARDDLRPSLGVHRHRISSSEIVKPEFDGSGGRGPQAEPCGSIVLQAGAEGHPVLTPCRVSQVGHSLANACVPGLSMRRASVPNGSLMWGGHCPEKAASSLWASDPGSKMRTSGGAGGSLCQSV